MALGDLLFIAAFIILPILIIIWGVRALRTVDQRRRPARPAAQTTLELSQIEPEPRNWAASVRPLRSRSVNDLRPVDAARPFRAPIYRSRAGGAVARFNPPTGRGQRRLRTPQGGPTQAARPARGESRSTQR